jgi:cystathionine beta-lyase/cystathionine gamma-synthase
MPRFYQAIYWQLIMKFETLAIHAGQGPDSAFGAVMPPIYQTSTFAFKGYNQPGKFDYTRSGNPTRAALEECLAALENGTRGFAFATGMAASATLLSLFNAGDHVIVHDDLYGGTYRLLVSILAPKGIEVEFVNLRDLDALQRAIKKNTRGIWTETPTNPLMNLLDLEVIAKIAKSHTDIITFCDNTFLSPYYQKPLDLGIDVVMHSTTKYLNGHSDVVGGGAIVKDEELGNRIFQLQNGMGTGQAPFDCFLVMRGIKTLPVRMERHNENALTIAKWLESHPKVTQVLHPGLKSHPQHELSQKQMSGYGGTFSFRVINGKVAEKLLSSVKIYTLAESLGGVESLIEQPWTMTHLSMPEDVRRKLTLTEDLIRISVGIEHVDDLIADLDQALA